MCPIDKTVGHLWPIFIINTYTIGRSQWPRGLRRMSAAAGLMGLPVRIPPVACVCMSVVSVTRLSGRGLCPRADHSSKVGLPSVVCLSMIVKASIIRRNWTFRGYCAMEENIHRCFLNKDVGCLD